MPNPKRRGAPPGNKNAYRHGAYAQSNMSLPPGKPVPPSPSAVLNRAPQASHPVPKTPPENPAKSAQVIAQSVAAIYPGGKNFSPKRASRLSLALQIDLLQYFFLRIACHGSADLSLEQLSSTARTLSILAASMNRLIITQDWLTKTSGYRVQYSHIGDLTQLLHKEVPAISQIRRYQPASSPRNARPEFNNVEPVYEEVKQLSRQCNMSVSEILAGIKSRHLDALRIVPHIVPQELNSKLSGAKSSGNQSDQSGADNHQPAPPDP